MGRKLARSLWASTRKGHKTKQTRKARDEKGKAEGEKTSAAGERGREREEEVLCDGLEKAKRDRVEKCRGGDRQKRQTGTGRIISQSTSLDASRFHTTRSKGQTGVSGRAGATSKDSAAREIGRDVNHLLGPSLTPQRMRGAKGKTTVKSRRWTKECEEIGQALK